MLIIAYYCQDKINRSHKNIKVSVIIVNWNGKQHLEECLDSLSKQTFKAFETILVDNGSTDGSVEYVKQNFPGIRIVELDQNEGFCGGNNIGLQHARGDFIALLNNDTLVDIHWLEELYKAMTKHSHVGICASCIVNYYSHDVMDTAGDGFDLCGVGYKIGEGISCIVKKSAGCHRGLAITLSALKQSSRSTTHLLTTAYRALKSVRPAQENEIVNARFLCREALSEFGEVLWKILHTPILHIMVSGVKCIAPLCYSHKYFGN